MLELADLLEARVAVPADISADGESVLVASNLSGTMQLYRMSSSGGLLERLTSLDEPVAGRFVPGGERVLVQMDTAGDERAQLYLLDPGGEPERLVHDPRFMHANPCFTRDGRLLAYASNRRDGVDFDVYVRELESGEERCAYAPGGWCDPAGFSPDGRVLAVLRRTLRAGDNVLVLVDLETRDSVEVAPHDEEAYVGPPGWLADGRSFLFATSAGRDTIAIGRYDVAARTWEVVLESPWDLAAVVDDSGTQLLVHENQDGYSRLELRDPGTLELRHEVELPGRGVVTDTVFSGDGRLLAFHFSAPLEPGDIWLHDTDSGETRRLTTSPSEVPRSQLVEPDLHRFESFDGESVPVYLYEAEDDYPVPVVIWIHGGPESQLRPAWNALHQYFVARGFAVAAPNVRGSTGYGKRYEHLDDVEKRLDSVRDLAALHDWLERRRGIDASRAVLFGGSYGGYMVLAGLAFHAELWAAGVDIVGISSLVTFLENTSAYRRAYREREYGSLERDRELLESISPISRVDEIRAPLFIIHGANDPRVPLSEAEQLHRELTARGVPSELVVYEDEGHGLGKLKNRLDAYPRAAAFLESVLLRPFDRNELTAPRP
ncbi:MAG: prolyl oligopeptidase family serine peptidase [Gaiellaceae bacterium]